MDEQMVLSHEQVDAIDKALQSVQTAIDQVDAIVQEADRVVYGVLSGESATRETLLDIRQQCAVRRKELAEKWRQLGVVRNAIEQWRRVVRNATEKQRRQSTGEQS